MSEKKSTIRLRDYLTKGKVFVIPDYQRGYVWGKRRPNEDDSVTYLIRGLRAGFSCSPRREVFLQGVTVTECDDEISIIDGQQRTTFFYLLLKYLGCNVSFKIRYLSGREQSGTYLEGVTEDSCDPIDEREQFQDIYFFKKTLNIFRGELRDVPKKEFSEYLLDCVRFLYIDIPREQASRVFTMMNGNKATMLAEEVIKAEVLRVASRSEVNCSQDLSSAEWQANLLRSRYAREWDKWLHWWNRADVKKMFRCDNVMGLLISSVVGVGEGALTFEMFREAMLPNHVAREAKLVFDRLRRQQKLFEDLFNNPTTHNQIGAIVSILRKQGKPVISSFVRDLTARPLDVRLKLNDYYKCVFLGMSHNAIARLLDIISAEEEKDLLKAKELFRKQYDSTFQALRDPLLYESDSESRECAFRYLLRRNIDQDMAQGRKFDFSIWDCRSLEHIHAKSKVWHWDDKKEQRLDGNGNLLTNERFQLSGGCYLARDDISVESKDGSFTSTEHGIGNLVLLYYDENRDFNASSFEEKKELFFNPNKTKLMKSRRLLHTVCVFAEQKGWGGEEIAQNARHTLAEFEEFYSDLYGRFYV